MPPSCHPAGKLPSESACSARWILVDGPATSVAGGGAVVQVMMWLTVYHVAVRGSSFPVSCSSENLFATSCHRPLAYAHGERAGNAIRSLYASGVRIWRGHAVA